MKRIALALATTFALALATAAPSPAATTPTLQERIDAILTANPGASQTGWNEVTMSGGDAVLTLVPDAGHQVVPMAAVGDCAAGKFCAYSKTAYSGDKITYSTCTSNHSVAGLDTVRSIANSRTSGTVRAYNGSTLLATITPGTGKSFAGTTTKLTCS